MAEVPDEARWILDEYDAPRFWEHVDLRGGFAFLDDPLARVDRSAGECWIWGGWNTNGYGMFRIWGRVEQAHSLAFRDFGHRIPDGHEIDHLCRVHACVNPHHLEAVTAAENVNRGAQSLLNRSHCRHGHRVTPETVGTRMSRGKPIRYCIPCRTEQRQR
jgi:hypothetical protein